jgi:hypothetical protein
VIRSILISVIILILMPLATLAQNGGTVYDGHYWQQCRPDVKHLLVNGVMEGVLLGQDRVIGYALLNKNTSIASPECQRGITGIVNTLERQIEKWDRNRFVAALDHFYDDADNRALTIKWAVRVVMLEMHGAPQETIEDAPEPSQ